MNTLFLTSALIATFTVVGHCTIGRKQFFLPMVEANFDQTAKRVMGIVWHMSTVALALPAITLFYAAQYADRISNGLILFIVVQYALWTGIHFFFTVTSGVPGALYKFFQWALCAAIAITAYLGM
ncbi:MAG: hypothetical protein OQJ97_12350 [Rhodospirillales bacterium]|nr:hypothetical protein [Rhodospirillales bacterium]